MAEKRVLIADADSRALEGFRKSLDQQWTVTTVTGGNAALAEMKKNPCDVVIADLDLPEINGAELLNLIRTEYPRTILFILGSDADKERVMKNVLGAHQFLTKPCDGATLKDAISRALALDVWVASNKMRELIARVRTFPTVPSLYFEVLGALRDPSATTEQVGAIIAKDMAMTTKMLQVLNSAYFGLSRKITDPVEAVGILGFDAAKSMVLSLKLLSQYDQVKPVYFSVDRLWRHSTQVARKAKQLVLVATGDRTVAESAFTAGLMHDLGKIILASNFDEQYRGVQSLAARQRLPLWEVEKEIFGAHHGEIAAYLLGLWGMPLDLLEASALHHQPSQSITRDFTSLTAVHIANAWEHEAHPDKEVVAASKIDEVYVTSLGISEQLSEWHTTVYRDAGKAAPKKTATKAKISKTVTVKAPATTPAMAAIAPMPAAATVSAQQILTSAPKPLAPARYGFQHSKRVYTIAAAAAVVFVASVLAVFHPRMAEPVIGAQTVVRARSIQDEPAAAVVAEKPVVIVASSTPVAVAPKPVLAPPTKPVLAKPLTLDDLKLQGIFFSAHQPSAILNGNLVHPNDKLGEMYVVDIGASTVTIELHKQRKVLKLK